MKKAIKTILDIVNLAVFVVVSLMLSILLIMAIYDFSDWVMGVE